MLPRIVYFSSVSNNTERFIERLAAAGYEPAAEAKRIPLRTGDPELLVTEPYVLVFPTYGGGTPHGAVPKQVIRFLNNASNRAHIHGVVATGNTNFGAGYCYGGDVVAQKTKVPVLNRVEIFGTPDDIEATIAALRALRTEPQSM